MVIGALREVDSFPASFSESSRKDLSIDKADH